MTTNLDFPKLRWPLDIRIEKIQSGEVLVIMCPIGLSKAPLALVPAIAPVLSCFEGSFSTSQILDRFSAQGLTPELLQQLITLLDEHLFLATPKFFAAHQSMLDQFANSDVREAALAGLSYSGTKLALEKEIDTYFENGKTVLKMRPESMCGIVAPHIDYRRGSMCYGITYNNLKQEDHNIYLVIGTSHQFSRHIFHLTAKDFETPLGRMTCAKDFVNKLGEIYGNERSFADEILHRKEHSLELQTPFIKRLKANASLVPVLVGSFHHMLSAGKLPTEFEEYDKFVSALCECLSHFANQGKRICIVAGVDMAHVGRAFGDVEALNTKFMENVAERDQIYLETIKSQDKKSMFAHIAEDNDERRVCGFPTMYTVVDVFDRLNIKYKAEVFDYRQAVDYERDCAVTFAGIGLYCNSSAWTSKIL